MLEPRRPPPKPEVVHLPTLFRRVESGEIRIPKFQRPFVWLAKDIVELLESVYRGYPVGSLLFWKPDSPDVVAEVEEAFGRVLPRATFGSFVLDGQQRLTSLYRSFFFRAGKDDSLFDVVFDLTNKTFWPRADYRGPAGSAIAISTLFSAKEFLEQQRRLFEEPAGEILADAAIDLHSRFQEYMIPAVTIEGRGVPEVVEIFERVNRTGSSLSTVDFMRAVTWSGDFDLQGEVKRLGAAAASVNFMVPDETLVKVIAVAAGRAPISEDMVRLRQATLAELHNAVSLAETSMLQAIEFLRDECGVTSYDFVPYEAQLLVMCRTFQLQAAPSNAVKRHLARWFWAASFNESLRGTPDHVVARLVKSADALLAGDASVLPSALAITAQDIAGRRFLRGKALSGAMVCLFAARGARSMVSGEVIPPESYTGSFESGHFKPVSVDVQPARTIANMFVCSDADWSILKRTSVDAALAALRMRGDLAFQRTIDSQMITPECLVALRTGDISRYILLRAQSLVEGACGLIEKRD